MAPDQPVTRVPLHELHAFCCDILGVAGVARDAAVVIADMGCGGSSRDCTTRSEHTVPGKDLTSTLLC